MANYLSEIKSFDDMRLIRADEVCELSKLDKRMMFEMICREEFPGPVLIALDQKDYGNVRYWSYQQVRLWCDKNNPSEEGRDTD